MPKLGIFWYGLCLKRILLKSMLFQVQRTCGRPWLYHMKDQKKSREN